MILRNYHRSIAVLSVTALVFPAAAMGHHQNSAARKRVPVFTFSGLKKVYKESERVVFKVANISVKSSDFVACTAEVFWEGRWNECTQDVRVHIMRKEIYHEFLAPGKTRTLHWNVKQNMFHVPNAKTGRRYRFVLYNGEVDEHQRSVRIVSPEILILKH